RARHARMIGRPAHRKQHGRGSVMVRDSRGSIGDGELGAGVRGPASSPPISLFGPIVRAAARWFKKARIVPDSPERLSGMGRFSPWMRRLPAMMPSRDRKRGHDPSRSEPGGATETPRMPRLLSPLRGSPRLLREPERWLPGPVDPHTDEIVVRTDSASLTLFRQRIAD